MAMATEEIKKVVMLIKDFISQLANLLMLSSCNGSFMEHNLSVILWTEM